jgi:hypothetical protein
MSVCARPGKCETEYDRQWGIERRAAPQGQADKERRNEIVRRQRQRQKGEPSVYAVRFPAPGVLKVGFTTDTQDSIFVGVARTRAKRRGWEPEGSSCIWKQPGDLRTEAWMQATLAFRWRPAFEQVHSRICEWFSVPDLLEEEIAGALDSIYRVLPADLTGNDLDPEPAGPLALW